MIVERHHHREFHYHHESAEIQDFAVEILGGNASCELFVFLIDRDLAILTRRLSYPTQIAVVNNVLKWSIGELKIRFRTNLSKYLFNEYMK